MWSKCGHVSGLGLMHYRYWMYRIQELKKGLTRPNHMYNWGTILSICWNNWTCPIQLAQKWLNILFFLFQDEQRVEQRKKNLLVLILHHLVQEGYTEAAKSLEHESSLSFSRFEVCDNVDLDTILMVCMIGCQDRWDTQWKSLYFSPKCVIFHFLGKKQKKNPDGMLLYL